MYLKIFSAVRGGGVLPPPRIFAVPVPQWRRATAVLSPARRPGNMRAHRETAAPASDAWFLLLWFGLRRTLFAPLGARQAAGTLIMLRGDAVLAHRPA